VAKVLIKMGDLRWGHANEREGRQLVFGEELRVGSFVAIFGSTSDDFGHEEHFVGVKGVGRMAMKVAVENGGKLGETYLVARFFAGLADGGKGRTLAHIGPTTGKRPAAIFQFADEKDAPIAKSANAHIDFRRGVAGLLGE